MNVEKRLDSNKEELQSILREMVKLSKDNQFEAIEEKLETLQLRLEMIQILSVLNRE